MPLKYSGDEKFWKTGRALSGARPAGYGAGGATVSSTVCPEAAITQWVLR